MLRFAAVSGCQSLPRVQEFRERMYRSPYHAHPETRASDANRDAAGHVFIAEAGPAMVATLRFLPMQPGLSELNHLGLLPAFVGRDDPSLAEGGRLAAQPRSGGATPYGLLMQVWASAWALAHTSLRGWIAWSQHGLLRVHRRVGGTVLCGPREVPTLGPGEFVVVAGRLDDVVRNGELMGLKDLVRSAETAVGSCSMVSLGRT